MLQFERVPWFQMCYHHDMTDEKVKFLMRIDPATDRKVKTAIPLANCRSQNEFVEKALQFYCDYVSSQDCFSVLPPMLVAAIRATVQTSENHICRLLFKLAVEMDMMMNVLAAAMEIPEEQLRELRGRCIQEVKKTHGMISLDDAVEYQNGGDGV